ncbi:cytidylyltransferase domain-containing protein [Granulosicoccus antarcticus]|uniref:CMP-N,N'-diacetyllegionaminic acid synthase n=1 Tax=Granulosicoccus antarcticus IMCC3135 TaxID=1192854 RepID=A0A2Z2P445_9GAMM|nr:acylneuraminate cytidylyltransferase family protein [Granulosicoccus antarcticus]ASJ74604.1 CMP-N,N'-diacetyllegionaminic acid synthase [Granulosicoccus antarcticus IMCC3135]
MSDVLLSGNIRILAIIPARGGSKRLPGKNTMQLLGKSLVEWSFDESQKSKYLSMTIISSDDEKVKTICDYRNMPFINRDTSLATDSASSVSVVLSVLDELSSSGVNFDYCCLLQPTSPLRRAEHIDEAITMLKNSNKDSIVSVCRSDPGSHWFVELKNAGRFSEIVSYGCDQDGRNNEYSLNGAIYVSKISVLRERESFFGPNTLAYPMLKSDSVDIDTFDDFKHAEDLLSKIC